MHMFYYRSPARTVSDTLKRSSVARAKLLCLRPGVAAFSVPDRSYTQHVQYGLGSALASKAARLPGRWFLDLHPLV
jgi:hypothetical protein